jgi:putative tryptophan/tyrosine transport system substrate-binding protein
MKLAYIFAVVIGVLVLISCKPQTPKTSITIGIIEPVEHTAMTAIVEGFAENLHKIYHKPVIIKIENAQNDPNLQRAIIQKMDAANYDILVPIGVAATQMTLAMVHDKPVIGLAANLSNADRQHLRHCNVAIVHDEISVQQLLSFIHAVYPQLTTLSLVHSAADKVLPEVQTAIAAGKQFGITVKPVMVTTLPELYTAAQSLPSQTEGIFILKDVMIVSGISTLAKVATDRHIPLITSDQGSVQDGAGFALGVHEREIGASGAQLAAGILSGTAACALPIVDMEKLTVFTNAHALVQSGQDIQEVTAAAQQAGFSNEMIGET